MHRSMHAAFIGFAALAAVTANSADSVDEGDSSPPPSSFDGAAGISARIPATATNAIKGNVVYFTPMDENTSATILFVYNTSDTSNVFNITAYYSNGSKTLSVNIPVAAHALVRICSDTVSTISASWTNYVLVNFTTFSVYGTLTLPKGFHANGYIAWDSSGVYDPLMTNVPVMNLTFTSNKPRKIVP